MTKFESLLFPVALTMSLMALVVASPITVSHAQSTSVGDGMGDPDSLDDFSEIFPDEAPSFDTGEEPETSESPTLGAPEAPAGAPEAAAPVELAPEPMTDESFANDPILEPAPDEAPYVSAPPLQAPPTPAPALQSDFEEPAVGATGYEKRFHSIYQNYIKTPTSQEKWTAVVGSRDSEIYAIQEGDTLWDISRTFFDDGGYWPKMWAINSAITNPHLIAPGFQIQFLAGTLHQSPSMQITKVGEGGPVAQASLPPEALQAGVTLPPSSVIPPKSKEPIPASFPQYSYLPTPVAETDVIIETVIKKFPPPTIAVTSFVSDKNYYSRGTVIGAENGSDQAVSFDLILIKSNGPSEVGKSYTVIRKNGEVSAPTDNGYESEVRIISRYEAQGVVRIKEVVNSLENIYRAEVLRSFDAVTTGSMLVDEKVNEVNLALVGQEQAVRGHIIGGHSMANTEMFGPSSFVFIDAGSNQGVAPGQLIPIFSNPLVRFRDVRTLQNQRRIGTAKIASVTPLFSTAITLELSEEVRVGDLTARESSLVKQGPRALKWVPSIAPDTGLVVTPPEMASSGAVANSDSDLEDLTQDFDFSPEGESDVPLPEVNDSDFEDFDF